MIVALALFAAAIVLGFAAPRWLARLAMPGRNPRVALAAWVSTQVLFVFALVGGPLAVATRPGLRVSQLPLPASCVRAARDAGMVPWLPYVETALWMIAGALVGRIFLVVTRAYRRHRRDTAAHLNLIRILGEAGSSGKNEVVWLRDTACAAYSVGGRNGTVVASEGLKALDPLERRAVLDHEHAHIRGRHHMLVMISRALGTALPFVPLCRLGATWVKVLVEPAADNRAADSCGHEAVRGALLRCARTPEPATRDALSDNVLDARLRWLDPAPRPGRSRRALTYPAALTVSAFPALVTGGSVIGIVAASCLTV
ncbi:M56 family metallopeptidase [Rhodococcus chondri]|uniref:M56 family metallopeptidase n=1 Tax=Rhodococcus chondri TaxID=3065941 RepID=A0ABU7JRH4_9NOCA|nr:M56 family metallopeptidase [Rhodococcus sp. CC-R104]MEE2032347.1 M56 family metallopeptidase [Rhodococcus sp. CC-R104]